MRRTTFALAAAAMVAAAMSSPADAHCHGCGVAAGAAAGAIAGALIGSAITNPPPPVYVDPGAAAYDAVPPATYVPPPPGDPDAPGYIEGACHFERQQVWDGTRYRLRRVEICE